jgi:sulfite reductase (NADPH) flavoprotein alpha-component
MPAATFQVELVPSGKLTPSGDVIVPKGARLIPMTSNTLLSPQGYDRDIRHYEFNLAGQVSYNLGDSLGIYPWNKKTDVQAFLRWYGIPANQVLKIKDLGNTGKFPDVVTTEQIFTQTLDLFGRPNRRFYEMLALNAKDAKEKEEINFLMSKAGQKAFKQFLTETPTFFDVLQKWPSAKLSLEYLLEFLPPIRPRLYSIASAPEVDQDNLHLCIVFDDWTTPSGRYRHGLTTGYLKELAPTSSKPVPVACRVNNASFTLPASHQQPLIMVALGTGIAPMRALIRERLRAKAAGVKVGPMALFFGVRYKKSEYSYGADWDALHDNGNGPLTILEGAFSRDQKQKVYVQDKLAAHKQAMYDWIVKNNGYYLLCGPSGPPCTASRAAIVDAIATCGAADGFDKEKAEQYVTDMHLSGRYNEEVW